MQNLFSSETALNFLRVSLAMGFGQQLSYPQASALAQTWGETRAQIKQDELGLEQGNHPQLVNAELLTSLKSDNSGVIVASFHLGLYMALAVEIGYLGYDIFLTATQGVIRKRSEQFQRLAQLTGKQLELLPSQSPRTAIRLLRQLKQGGLTLFYIDGNTGTAGLKGGEKHGANFQLLAMPVRMRTGIAFLAHKAQVPIVVAVTYYNPAGEAVVEFLEQIPMPANASDAARIDCTTTIYSHFETYLQRYPAQWEGWFYPHRFLENIEHPPLASATTLQQVQTDLAQKLATNDNPQLQANPLQVCVIPSPNGNVIFDGKARRVLQANPLACQIVEAALQSLGLVQLRQQLGVTPTILANELSRLLLSGLVTLAGYSAPGVDPPVPSVPTHP